MWRDAYCTPARTGGRSDVALRETPNSTLKYIPGAKREEVRGGNEGRSAIFEMWYDVITAREIFFEHTKTKTRIVQTVDLLCSQLTLLFMCSEM